jgi:hypothetical protein
MADVERKTHVDAATTPGHRPIHIELLAGSLSGPGNAELMGHTFKHHVVRTYLPTYLP